MREAKLTRRNFVVGITALSAFAQSAKGAYAATQTIIPMPPEAATLLTRGYGRKRIAKVQHQLRMNGMDALLVANRALDYISYVSNFHPYPLQPAMALIPADGNPTLYANMYSHAHTRALRPIVWIEDFIDVPRDEVSEGSNLNLLVACAQKIKTLRLQRARIAIAGEEVDWGVRGYLQGEISSLHVEDGNQMLSQLISVKDDVELALIRHSQRWIDEIAFPAYQELMKPGVRDTDVYSQIVCRLLQQGADPSTFVLFDAGPAGSGTWARGAMNLLLQPTDIVLSEPVPPLLGYQAEKMFTFALARSVSQAQADVAHATAEAFQFIMENCKAGRDLTTVIDGCNAVLAKRGYQGNTVPLGHFIGSQNHEGPRFTSTGTRGWVIKPNMVFSWHPNVVVHGKARASSSACVLVTEKGPVILSKIPMEPIYYL